MLVFSLVGGETVPQDTTLLFGSCYVLLGIVDALVEGFLLL